MTFTILIALVAFLFGLILGLRTAARGHRTERAQLERRYQRIVDYADDYIESNATGWGVRVIRNESGHIVQLATRCATPAVLSQDFLDEQRRRKALH
jgi:hypothetical protein